MGEQAAVFAPPTPEPHESSSPIHLVSSELSPHFSLAGVCTDQAVTLELTVHAWHSQKQGWAHSVAPFQDLVLVILYLLYSFI